VRGKRVDRTSNSPYRLDELGWLQFERLGMGLPAVEAGSTGPDAAERWAFDLGEGG
jgi:hypothetical protein